MSVKPKEVNIAVDFSPYTDLSAEIMRADSINFMIGFSAAFVESADEMRIFAYAKKNHALAFSKIFNKQSAIENGDITDSGLDGKKWRASFSSSETATLSGPTIMTVQLASADNDLINSQNIQLLIQESNSTTPAIVSEPIRDSILDDIETEKTQSISDIQSEKTSALYSISQAKSDSLGAISNAKDDALQDIEVYTDPDGRISNLEKITSKVGRFYVNGGNAQRTFSTLGSVPFSFCFSYAKKTAWKNGDMPFNSGNISPSANENGISMYIAGGLVNFYFEVKTKSALQTGSKLAIPYSKFPTDGKLHTVQFIVPSADVATWKAFIDGEDITAQGSSTAGNFDGSFALDSILSFGGTGILGNPLEVEFARIFIANYDMSVDGAPYSVADYAAGKLPPPSICDTSAEKRALLALDDYSIEIGSTKYIPDISGGANDFTVAGDFKGDKDISIKRLAALVAQSNA
nr:MAG TPA: hypothetical protein [Caudoviricetes sp.]